MVYSSGWNGVPKWSFADIALNALIKELILVVKGFSTEAPVHSPRTGYLLLDVSVA
jgi:hypothetical protein